MKRLLTLAACCVAAYASAADGWRFQFSGAAQPGYTAVAAGSAYSAQRGYGFEPDRPNVFSLAVPEGNYTVHVRLGATSQADTTIKAELRRLMVERVDTAPGQTIERSFTVNVRTPSIPAVDGIVAGEVKLKTPREAEAEAWAWDQRLTLEFEGQHPAVQSIEIEPASTPTIFLLGDSTVADQMGEPYASWGQMLTRFFNAGIAVANHAESGETYRDSIARRRLDKVVSALKRGDTVLLQFGHNDQKQIAAGTGNTTTYKAELRTHIERIRARGGVPVVLSPMERRGFDAQGAVRPSLADYAQAAREAAQEANAPFIDLNAASKQLYATLGADGSRALFAQPAPDKIDNTHHSNYGAYELAKLVIEGLKTTRPELRPFVAQDFGSFDPTHPDPVSAFRVPPSRGPQAARPLGDDAMAYVFAYFVENGKDGLHLAASTDGYHWDKLGGGKSVLISTVGDGLIRDPCLLRGPDGAFHLVWTSGWNDSVIGYASSPDLKTWTTPRAIRVMEPGARNAWAPEIAWDDKRREYMIFWASTVPGRFAQTAGSSEDGYNHRIYYTTSRDLQQFAPAQVLFDPGFSSIDASFLRKDGKTWLIYKDETRTPPRKHLLLAPMQDLHGPVGPAGPPISPAGEWAEGPTALQVGADTIVYYDAYMARHYRALRSRDLVHWEDVTPQMHFPDEDTPGRMRHGTAIAVPASLLPTLR